MPEQAEDILVELPNGKLGRFPAGTKPEVIEAVKARVAAQTTPPNPSPDPKNSAAAPPATPISAPAGGGARPGGLADAYVTRMLRGAMVNRVDPGAEMLVRGARAAAPGLVSEDAVRDVQAMNRERAQLQRESNARAGDTGIDDAALLGTMGVDMLALGPMMRAIGKPHLAAPRSLLDLGKAGAIAGGTAGLIGPTEGSEDMSDLELAIAKGKQTGVGTGVGAVASPAFGVLADKFVQGARALGRGAVDAVKRVVVPSTGQRTAANSQQLEIYLSTQAGEAGVDWARVPEHVKASLREATRRATITTGELPNAAVKNRLIAEAENLPPLTTGQATRNPVAYSREANNPDEEIRSLFENQRIAATERLGGLGQAFGAPLTPQELGERVRATVSAQGKAMRDATTKLANEARDDPAGYQVIQNTTDFAKSAVQELKKQQLWSQLPADLKTQLALLTSNGGRFKLSARQAAQMIQNINGLTTDKRDPTNVALGVVKTKLNEMLDNPQFRDAAAGAGVIDKFRAMSKSRREMGQWEESSTAIAELVKRNPRIASERIFDRYVIGGSIDDFKGLWKTLPPEIRANTKRAFVDHVSNMALNQYGTNATKAGSAVEFLRKYPKEKLSQMFSEPELKSLRNTLEYLRLTTEAPPGSFVNRSNSLVDLKDFISQTQNVPVLGPGVTGPLRRLVNQNEAAEAARSGALAVPPEAPPTPELLRRAIERAPAAMPSIGQSAAGAPIMSPEEEN